MQGVADKKGTRIFLPLKTELLGSNFIEEVSKSIDPVALLHLRNLKRLVVSKDVDPKSRIKFTRTREALPSLDLGHVKEIFGDELVKIKANIITISRVEEGKDSFSCKFLQIGAKISVPSSMTYSSSSTRKTVKVVPLALSFPLDPEHDSVSKLRGVDADTNETESLPVCAFLPIRDLGFRFGLHSNWEVVTSRDEVFDNRWNRYLRDCAGKFLVSCFKLPGIREKSLSTFIPRHFVGMSPFWTHFVDTVQGETVSSLERGLRHVVGKDLLERLNLSEAQLSEFAQISLIDEKSLHHVRHNIPELSVIDILDCLRGGWKIDDDKWTALWQVINETVSENKSLVSPVAEKLLTSPVFLGNSSEKHGERGKLPAHVTRVFVSPGNDDTPWRDEWAVLKSASEIEKATLEKLFLRWVPATIVDQIFSIHLNSSHTAENLRQLELKEVEGDFRYFMQNREEVLHYHRKVNSGTPSLFVPGKAEGSSELQCIKIEECQLPKVFGVEISSVGKNVVSLPTTELAEEIRLESLLLSLGCAVPTSDFLVANTNTVLDFKNLAELKKDLEIILSHVRDSNILDQLKPHLRVLVNNKPVPCSSVYACSELEGVMATIGVPNNLRELARKFGIKFEISAKTRLDALKALVHREEKQQHLYLFWLGGLGIHHKISEVKEIISETGYDSLPLILLSPILRSNTKKYFSIKDIIIPPIEFKNSLALHQACHVLGKTIISDEINSGYYSLKQMLVSIGCAEMLEPREVVKALKGNAKDESLFLDFGAERNLVGEF
jgi:hypothetical protein